MAGREDAASYVDDFNTGWHWDTPNLTTIHIMLNDTARGASHMLFAKGSHRRRHVRIGDHDKWYSELYIRKHYEIIDCDGPLGTVYIFDNNGVHRLHALPGTFRALLQNNYTPREQPHLDHRAAEDRSHGPGDVAPERLRRYRRRGEGPVAASGCCPRRRTGDTGRALIDASRCRASVGGA